MVDPFAACAVLTLLAGRFNTCFLTTAARGMLGRTAPPARLEVYSPTGKMQHAPSHASASAQTLQSIRKRSTPMNERTSRRPCHGQRVTCQRMQT